MQKILFFLLLAIPLLGFGQNIGGTGWKLSQNDGVKKIIILELDHTFTYLNVKIDQWNERFLYSDATETWRLEGDNIIISFSDGFKVHSGKINRDKDYIWGTWVNEKDDSGTWSAELIKF